MATYDGHKETAVDKALFSLVIAALALLFIALSQPIWRGEQMVQELKDRCAIADGSVYERKSWLGGTVYECIRKGEQL